MHNIDLVVLVVVILAAVAIDSLGPSAKKSPKRSPRSYAIAAVVALGVMVQLSSAVGLLRAMSLNLR